MTPWLILILKCPTFRKNMVSDVAEGVQQNQNFGSLAPRLCNKAKVPLQSEILKNHSHWHLHSPQDPSHMSMFPGPQPTRHLLGPGLVSLLLGGGFSLHWLCPTWSRRPCLLGRSCSATSQLELKVLWTGCSDMAMLATVPTP